jgi:hypothetical protein
VKWRIAVKKSDWIKITENRKMTERMKELWLHGAESLRKISVIYGTQRPSKDEDSRPVYCIYCRICPCISRTFLTRIYPPKLGCGLCTLYYVLFTTKPATPVLYVVKLPVETASAWDCYLASYCTRPNTPTYYCSWYVCIYIYI